MLESITYESLLDRDSILRLKTSNIQVTMLLLKISNQRAFHSSITELTSLHLSLHYILAKKAKKKKKNITHNLL